MWVCGRVCGGAWVVGVWRAGVVGWVGGGVWGCGWVWRSGEVGVWRERRLGACAGGGAGQACQVLRLAPGRVLQRKGWRAMLTMRAPPLAVGLDASRPPARTTTRVLRSSSPAADAVAWSCTGTLRVPTGQRSDLMAAAMPRLACSTPSASLYPAPATRRGRYGCGCRARRRSGLALRVRRVRVNSRCESSEGQRPRRAWYQIVPMPQERVPRITRKTM